MTKQPTVVLCGTDYTVPYTVSVIGGAPELTYPFILYPLIIQQFNLFDLN